MVSYNPTGFLKLHNAYGGHVAINPTCVEMVKLDEKGAKILVFTRVSPGHPYHMKFKDSEVARRAYFSLLEQLERPTICLTNTE